MLRNRKNAVQSNCVKLVRQVPIWTNFCLARSLGCDWTILRKHKIIFSVMNGRVYRMGGEGSEGRCFALRSETWYTGIWWTFVVIEFVSMLKHIKETLISYINHNFINLHFRNKWRNLIFYHHLNKSFRLFHNFLCITIVHGV